MLLIRRKLKKAQLNSCAQTEEKVHPNRWILLHFRQKYDIIKGVKTK